jgi:uncharacterized membrane protein
MIEHGHKKTGRHRKIDLMLSYVLRIGLAITFLTTLYGGMVLFWQNGSSLVEYQKFIGEPNDLKKPGAIIASAIQGEGIAIIQLGILLMIATPASRVLMCAIAFVFMNDYLYASLSTFVLIVLLYSFFY